MEQENLLLFTLSVDCEIIEIYIISQGTIDRTCLHPREIFHYAIDSKADYIVLAHNHPSGNLNPSDNDCETFENLNRIGDNVGIWLIDSVVFSRNGYFSLRKWKAIFSPDRLIENPILKPSCLINFFKISLNKFSIDSLYLTTFNTALHIKNIYVFNINNSIVDLIKNVLIHLYKDLSSAFSLCVFTEKNSIPANYKEDLYFDLLSRMGECGIRFCDFIVFNDNTFYSYRNENIIS